MSGNHGYIGRSPDDSSVIVARESFSVSGLTTDFEFGSGYDLGYLDAYLNGSRLINGSDYTATNGTTVTLGVAATTGDILECVAYKAFDLANVSAAGADFSVGNDLIVSGNASVVGVTTLASGGGITTTGGDFYVGGDLYVKDDITYDEVSGRQLVITGVGTFGSIIAGAAVTANSGGIDVTGVITATSFTGDGTGLTGVASTDYIITSTASTFAAISATSAVVGTAMTINSDGFDTATGIVTATSFVGPLTGNVTGNASGSSGSCSGNSLTATTATTSTNITVADESTDTTCNVVFVTAATGDLPPKTGTNLTFDSDTGALTATSFVGSGANLTGLPAGYTELDSMLFN